MKCISGGGVQTPCPLIWLGIRAYMHRPPPLDLAGMGEGGGGRGQIPIHIRPHPLDLALELVNLSSSYKLLHSWCMKSQVCRLTFQSDSINIKSRASCTYGFSGRMCTVRLTCPSSVNYFCKLSNYNNTCILKRNMPTPIPPP